MKFVPILMKTYTKYRSKQETFSEAFITLIDVHALYKRISTLITFTINSLHATVIKIFNETKKTEQWLSKCETLIRTDRIRIFDTTCNFASDFTTQTNFCNKLFIIITLIYCPAHTHSSKWLIFTNLWN